MTQTNIMYIVFFISAIPQTLFIIFLYSKFNTKLENKKTIVIFEELDFINDSIYKIRFNCGYFEFIMCNSIMYIIILFSIIRILLSFNVSV